MRTLFVYYKLPRTEHPEWAVRIRSFLGEVRAQFPGLEVSLMQRPEPNADGLETWMEVYRHPQGVDEPTVEAIEALARQLSLPSKRATEVFVELRA